MSLLLDALKKADEKKQQTAKRPQEKIDVKVPETTPEPVSGNNMLGDDQAEEKKSTSAIVAETGKLSLAPLTHTAALAHADKDSIYGTDVQSVEASAAFLKNPIMENTDSKGLAYVAENSSRLQDTAGLNNATEGLRPNMSATPFDDPAPDILLAKKNQNNGVYEETLLDVPADQLIKDLGGGALHPTPVAAQTVFMTGRSSTNKQSLFKWSVFLILAVLATVATAIIYHITITPIFIKLPPPLIAHGIESKLDLPPVIAQAPASNVMTDTIIRPVSAEKQITSAADAMIDNFLETDQVTVATAITAENIEPDANKISIDETSNNIATGDFKETLSTTRPVSRHLQQQLAKIIHPDSPMISISKNKTSEQANVMVHQAYKAYQNSHFDTAKSMYETVLKNDPDNRDAHLGLAAIAINNQDQSNAYYHYAHLLTLNPEDAIAFNALIGLSNHSDPLKDESAIKFLIKQEGDMPYLYFSLGNVYAKQRRWAAAQQAFFNAYRLDATNADYVFNLAVSLDQLDQYDTALVFYKTAINLATNSFARFNPALANNRIIVLSKLVATK